MPSELAPTTVALADGGPRPDRHSGRGPHRVSTAAQSAANHYDRTDAFWVDAYFGSEPRCV